jgi:hypothetical protein
MALANLVRVNCATVGTGTLTLGSAVSGFLTPTQAGMIDGVFYDYVIEADYVALGDDMVPTSREVGWGPYTASGGTLVRNVINSTNSNALLNLAGDAQVIIAFTTRSIRELLTGNRNYYVRAPVGNPSPVTFTGGSANIGIINHGLSVNDPVVLSILPNDRTCTISNASPAVITTSNSFAAGQPVVFLTAGYLPPGIVAGTTYYVIATGLSGSSFQISATPGGSAINTPKQTFTAASGTGGALQITASGTTNLVAGQEVAFSTTTTLPGGLSASTVYYVAASPAPTATIFYVSTTNGGTNVAFSTAGTGTHSIEQVGEGSSPTFGTSSTHRCRQTGAMPTFSTAGLLVAGTVYYVGTVVDANTITLSTTTGNANPLGTATVATGSPIYSAATGNDNNSGLNSNRAGAFLTIAAAMSAISGQIDFGGKQVNMILTDGTYSAGFQYLGWSGFGQLLVQGNPSFPSNVFLDVSSPGTPFGGIFELSAPTPGVMTFNGIKFRSTGSARAHISVQSVGCNVNVANCEFGPIPAGTFSTAISNNYPGTEITIAGGHVILGPFPGFLASQGGVITSFNQTLVILGVPAVDWNFVFGGRASFTYAAGITWSGSATGTRYQINEYSTLSVGGNTVPGNANGTTATGGQVV